MLSKPTTRATIQSPCVAIREDRSPRTYSNMRARPLTQLGLSKANHARRKLFNPSVPCKEMCWRFGSDPNSPTGVQAGDLNQKGSGVGEFDGRTQSQDHARHLLGR